MEKEWIFSWVHDTSFQQESRQKTNFAVVQSILTIDQGKLQREILIIWLVCWLKLEQGTSNILTFNSEPTKILLN